MRYKTTIQIVTEAKDRSEALEIAGDYLAGNISSGVDMRFSAKPVTHNAAKVIGAVTVSAMVVLAIIAIPQMRQASTIGRTHAGSSAIQPLLKTSSADDKIGSEFKREWQDRQTQKALKAIKQ